VWRSEALGARQHGHELPASMHDAEHERDRHEFGAV
jgi:hypothetical protein